MDRFPFRSRANDDLVRQRERAAEIRAGMRDLRNTLERLREVEELYGALGQVPPQLTDAAVEQPAEHSAQEMPQASRPAANGHGEPAAPPNARAETEASAALALQSNLTAFQRAIERLGGRSSTDGVTNDGSFGGGPLELLSYWKIIRKRLWLIVLLMIVGGATMGYYVYQQPPQYRSTTTLYLNPAIANTAFGYSAFDNLQSLASTYSEFMKTQSFADEVAQAMNGAVGEGQVLGALATQYVANTQFFRITATTGDPQLTQQLANTAAKVLIAENIARQQAEQEQRQTQSRPNPERERLIEMRTNLQQQLDLYNGQISTLQAQLDKLKAEPQSDENDKKILDIQQQMLNYQSLRQSAMTGLADTQAAITNVSDNSQPNLDTAVVVDVAPLPGSPLSSRLVEQVLVAIIVSLIAGVVIAFALEYMDYTIRTPEAMEAAYGMPAQGVVGIAAKKSRERGPTELVALNYARSPLAESFRALRTGVYVASLTSPVHSLMITSARPGEGKTFVAANLAVSLAQTGTKVILVDCDLRRPSQHYVFGLPNEIGFSNLVIDPDLSLDDGLQPTQVEGLRVLTCGVLPPNPAELIGSHRALDVIEQLSECADIVIFDTPPAATVTDALVIAPHVDAVLQVVLSGQTRIDVVRRCKTLLERNGAHLFGPVLNQVPVLDMTSYEYYYSYGYYGERQKTRRHKGQRSLKHSTAPLLTAVPADGSSNGNGNGAANGNGAHVSTNGHHDFEQSSRNGGSSNGKTNAG